MSSRFISLWPLYKDFFKRYNWQIILSIILGLMVGFSEGIGIGMLIPLFSFIVKGGSFGDDFISQSVISILSFFGASPSLALLLSFFASLFIFSAILTFISGYISNKITADYENEVKSKFYRQVFSASWSFLLSQKIGYLNYVLMNGVPAQVKIVTRLFNVSKALMSFFAYFIIAFYISPFITMVTLFFGGAVFFVFRPLAKRIEVYMKHISFLGTTIAHDINENVNGLKIIKAAGLEEEAAEKGIGLFRQWRDVTIKQFVVENLFAIFWRPFILLFIIGVFVFSYIYNRASFDLASFVAVIYLVQRIFMSTNKLQGTMYTFNKSFPFMELVNNLRAQILEHSETSRGSEPFVFNNILEFRSVQFHYHPENQVLADLTFSVNKGEMVGIAGPSGVGKTTICDLFLQLFKPLQGGIYLDGKPIADIRIKEWRRNIGYVAQDIFLKNDTVENNIKFFDESITDAEMVEAAKMANIYDFIQELPKKFYTQVGERGVLLSGGQRQRIILARALARHPKILLLDEATSSLDNESEFLIQQAIEKMKGGMTIIVVAHRLSTIMRADRVVVLEEGRIAEEGKPEELLERADSYFHKMHTLANVV